MIPLLQKYIENKCTESELHTLLKWLKSSENNCEFEAVSESFRKHIDRQIHYPDEKRIKELNREVNALLQKINQKDTGSVGKRKLFPRIRIYRIAAVFLLLIGMGTVFHLITNNPKEVTYKEIFADQGKTKEYTLDDGTHIVLNSESKIIIPSDYNHRDRNIEISGEAFFEVTPDPDKPFIVKNGNAQIKVLGTSFNVKGYENDNYMNVTVSTGKVLLTVPDWDLQLRIMPSEHLSFNKKTGNLTKSLLQENNYTRWMSGSLYFEKEPLTEVIKTINRKYDKKVILQCKDCKYILSGTHDNKSIESVIESVCFTTGLKYKEENGNIILYEE